MAIKIKGVDISKHQTSADFAKVKAAGFEFAILRCGYRGWGSGTVEQDERWLQHVQNAIANKMPYGVYFFSQAITEQEAIEEAQFCLKMVKAQKVQPLYPIYIDTEWANTSHTGRADGLSKAQRTAVVIAFCKEIEKAGYYAGIYASTSWFRERLNDNQLTSYDKWIAQYALRCTYKGAYGMWQYGGGTNYLAPKKVDGISSANCDQNYCYKDYPTIIKNNGLNGYNKKPKMETFTATATEGDIDKFVQLAEELELDSYSVKEVE